MPETAAELLRQPEDEHGATGCHRHVLATVNHEAHRVGVHRTTGLKLPQRLARGVVQGEEVTLVGTAEYQARRPWP